MCYNNENAGRRADDLPWHTFKVKVCTPAATTHMDKQADDDVITCDPTLSYSSARSTNSPELL